MMKWGNAKDALLWCVGNSMGDCTVLVAKKNHVLVYIFNAPIGELVLWFVEDYNKVRG